MYYSGYHTSRIKQFVYKKLFFKELIFTIVELVAKIWKIQKSMISYLKIFGYLG